MEKDKQSFELETEEQELDEIIVDDSAEQSSGIEEEGSLETIDSNSFENDRNMDVSNVKTRPAMITKKNGVLTASKRGLPEDKTNSEEYYNKIQKTFKQKTLRGKVMLNRIMDMIKRGNNQASQHGILESLKINDDWLINIEGHINHIDNIVRAPKSALKEERLIVNTSKAKKTDSETIRYLCSHTGDIESIHGDEIRPSKLNVREIDSDLCIYENRFVYALMVRLRSFLEQRYIAIKEQINCFDSNELKVNSKFSTPNGDVEYDLNIKLRDKRTDSVSVKENFSLLERIESCRTHISALMGSDFARTLSKAKLIMPPINKTNAIRGHVDYRGCYNLWLFLSSYTAVGYSIKVEEQNLELSDDYYDDLSFIISMSLKNMMDNNMINRSIFNAGEIRKKIKKFKPVKSFTYTPAKRNIAQIPDEQLFNQFYFEKLKQLLKESEAVKGLEEESLKAAFRTYYKSVSVLNNKLYDEALELEKYRETQKTLNTIESKQTSLVHYEEGLKRLKLLRSLKENDFKSIEREEKKAEERVSKLKIQIKELRDKQIQEALQKRLEAQRKALEKQEAQRMARLEKQRLIAEKKEQDIAERLEKKRILTEQKEREAAEKLAKLKQIEKEKEAAKILAAKEKEKEKLRKQREKERALEREKRLKEKENEKLQLQRKKEREKLEAKKILEKQKKAQELAKQKELKQKQLEKEKEKLRIEKQKEQEKLKAEKQKQLEIEKAARQKEKDNAKKKDQDN